MPPATPGSPLRPTRPSQGCNGRIIVGAEILARVDAGAGFASARDPTRGRRVPSPPAPSTLISVPSVQTRTADCLGDGSRWSPTCKRTIAAKQAAESNLIRRSWPPFRCAASESPTRSRPGTTGAPCWPLGPRFAPTSRAPYGCVAHTSPKRQRVCRWLPPGFTRWRFGIVLANSYSCHTIGTAGSLRGGPLGTGTLVPATTDSHGGWQPMRPPRFRPPAPPLSRPRPPRSTPRRSPTGIG